MQYDSTFYHNEYFRCQIIRLDVSPYIYKGYRGKTDRPKRRTDAKKPEQKWIVQERFPERGYPPVFNLRQLLRKLWLEYGGIMISACLVEGYIKHLVIRYRDGSEIGTG